VVVAIVVRVTALTFVSVIVPIARMRLMPVSIVTVPIMVAIPMRMPPQHQLLDDEEHPQPHEQRSADGMRSIRPNTLHSLRQQCQQCGTEQCARRVTDEVR
jgi:hypothetical protein